MHCRSLFLVDSTSLGKKPEEQLSTLGADDATTLGVPGLRLGRGKGREDYAFQLILGTVDGGYVGGQGRSGQDGSVTCVRKLTTIRCLWLLPLRCCYVT